MSIDTHSHLFFEQFQDDFDDVLIRAEEVGVKTMINVCIDISTSQA